MHIQQEVMVMQRMGLASILLVSIVAILVVGCSDSNETGTIRVLLTDAPADFVESALVTITRVYLVGGSDGHIDLMSEGDKPQTYDLLTLRDSLEAVLGEEKVPADTYSQLRLVVSEAIISLAQGYKFEDGSTVRPLKVPSGFTSGIKVKLAEPIDVQGGMVTIVVVDFDVNDNFVIMGGSEPEAVIKDVLFTPVLKEKNRAMEKDI